jgi:hypothetical protein
MNNPPIDEFGNGPDLRNPIPEFLLPRVGFPTRRPFDVTFEVIDQDSVGTGDEGNPPFFPTIVAKEPEPDDPEDAVYMRMVEGFIYTQRVEGGGSLSYSDELEITGLPVLGSEIPLVLGNKCWVTADEDANGLLSNAEFGYGDIPPVSFAAKLSGGSDSTGIPGSRTWLLCELIEVEVDNGEEEAGLIPQFLIHRTGIIEHIQPRRADNTVVSVAPDEGRVYDQSRQEDGVQVFRTLKGKRGQRIAEGGNETEDEGFVKVMMPEGVDGSVLYFTGADTEIPANPEIGEWVQLPPPETAAQEGFSWVLSTPGGGAAPEWIEISGDRDIVNAEGDGAGVLKGLVADEWVLRRIKQGDYTSVEENENDITIDVFPIANASGSGAGVFKAFENDEWVLRRIVGGEGVTVTENENDVTIEFEGGGGGLDHMWKTTVNDPVAFTYAVRGGVVTVQGTTAEIADSAALAGSANGYVVLKVTRDPDSRALDGVPVIEWSNTEPVNHASTPNEYYVLAEVGSGVVRQHRFEEIISYELMIVVNGEFKLGPFSMLTRDVYDPPV